MTVRGRRCGPTGPQCWLLTVCRVCHHCPFARRYTCMEETDPTHVTWAWVHEHGGTLDSNNFVLMLLNFGVLPVLLSKHEALDLFVRCEARNDGDEKANAVLYPTFLEALAEVRGVLERRRLAALAGCGMGPWQGWQGGFVNKAVREGRPGPVASLSQPNREMKS